ncbi:MAG TPA: AAA family ATPase, partial [Saprospiraceae bacterium]|nr:AAA family ATPase [Saprospiraceae bacterium]
TIHSFFGFPPKIITHKEIHRRSNYRIYQNLDMIIIDEISMVRADMLDNINYFLKINRQNKLPFGGVQMVFFGDLFQLPPVVSTAPEKQYFNSYYTSPYFFSSYALHEITLKMIELSEVFRQEERSFIQLLDNIRLNQMDYDDMLYLNERHQPIPEDRSFYITLSARNDIATRINDAELRAITEPQVQFQATVTGEFNPQLYPADLILILKTGAQVMFVKNDPQKQFVNGTIGIVEEVTEEIIRVKVLDNNLDEKTVTVEKQEWEVIRYEINPNDPQQISSKTVGAFTQYPLKLAWAITIHKSQGKTFERVIIDLGRGAFESGQTYVALSRCRTLGGIILTNPVTARDIFIDERIAEYYNQIKYLS